MDKEELKIPFTADAIGTGALMGVKLFLSKLAERADWIYNENTMTRTYSVEWVDVLEVYNSLTGEGKKYS